MFCRLIKDVKQLSVIHSWWKVTMELVFLKEDCCSEVWPNYVQILQWGPWSLLVHLTKEYLVFPNVLIQMNLTSALLSVTFCQKVLTSHGYKVNKYNAENIDTWNSVKRWKTNVNRYFSRFNCSSSVLAWPIARAGVHRYIKISGNYQQPTRCHEWDNKE